MGSHLLIFSAYGIIALLRKLSWANEFQPILLLIGSLMLWSYFIWSGVLSSRIDLDLLLSFYVHPSVWPVPFSAYFLGSTFGFFVKNQMSVGVFDWWLDLQFNCIDQCVWVFLCQSGCFYYYITVRNLNMDWWRVKNSSIQNDFIYPDFLYCCCLILVSIWSWRFFQFL